MARAQNDTWFKNISLQLTLKPRSPQLSEKDLTNSGKKDAPKKRVKRTLEEEELELLATPAGKENSQKHQQRAEESYKQALNAETLRCIARNALMTYATLVKNGAAPGQLSKACVLFRCERCRSAKTTGLSLRGREMCVC